MENCKNCKHSTFDEQWGEYKCSVLQRRVYILLSSDECNFYEKRPKEKKKGLDVQDDE